MICDICKEGLNNKPDTTCSLCGKKYFHLYGEVCVYREDKQMPIHIDVCEICYQLAANDEIVSLFLNKRKNNSGRKDK